jgi:hypothetical protein
MEHLALADHFGYLSAPGRRCVRPSPSQPASDPYAEHSSRLDASRVGCCIGLGSNVSQKGLVMDKDTMEKMVQKDLEHISSGLTGSPQNIFRSHYHNWRLHNLSKTPATTRRETFAAVLAAIRKDYPEFFPECDRDYFS